MTEIEQIKQLRDRTGAGLMDCKKALAANDHDLEKAITWLREKGIAKAAKKAATRIAAEGVASILVDGDKAAVIEINCETDFVANSDPFRALVKEVNEIVLATEPKSLEEAKQAKNAEGKSIEEIFVDAGVKLGEKLDFRRFEIVHKNPEDNFGPYLHMKGKIAVLTTIKGGNPEVANRISLVVCSNNPSYANEAEIPAEVIAKETEVQREASLQDPSFAKKPANIQDKIIEGRVKKSLFESVLADMGLIGEEDKSVAQLLKENNASLVSFLRFAVGEGIEKRQDDFAAEVAAQASGK